MEIGGRVAAGFERVHDVFAANFEERGEVGAACCVYLDGEPVVDLWAGDAGAGRPYTDTTLQMVASATKGALAIVAHRLAERGELDLDAPVTDYWPEFATRGVKVAWLLSHQAGLVRLDRPLTLDEIADWDAAAQAAGAAGPVWPPGTRHGYHAITYGWLVGEVVRRVTGLSPGTAFRREVAEPLGLDLHIGLPADEHARVAPLIPAATPDELTARLMDPECLAHAAFLMDSGLLGLLNDPRLWAAELPAGNGMGTATALARMYAAVIGPVDGVRLLGEDALWRAREERARGMDPVVGFETAFGLGFQLSTPFRPMAGPGSFGHYGLGGSVGFAHPELRFSFGYTVNQMQPGFGADKRSVPLVDAVLRSL